MEDSISRKQVELDLYRGQAVKQRHELFPSKCANKQEKTAKAFTLTVLVGEGGFEPPKALPADLQSVPFGHSGIPPYYSGLQAFHQKNISNHRNMFSHAKALETPRSTVPVNRKSERAVSNTWSWWTDSNPRPADYKSAALPTELHQHFQPA